MPDPTKSDSSQVLTPSFGTGDSSAPPPSFGDQSQPPVEPQVETKVESVTTNQQSSTTTTMDIPPVITPSDGGKKFGGGMGKMIATIFGVLILVLGLGAGIFLIRQQQDIRERASELPPDEECSPGEFDRTCTGNDAGCCPGGGEASVRQCDASGHWGSSFGECRGECAGDSCDTGGGGECTIGETRKAGCECNTTGCYGVQWVDECIDNGSGQGVWKNRNYNEQDSTCDGSCTGKCVPPTGSNCITTTVFSTGQCTNTGSAEASITFKNNCNTAQTVSYSSGARNCSRPQGATGCSACGLTETSKSVTVPANGEETVSESCDAGECETCQVDLTGGGKNTGAATWQGGACGGETTPPATGQCLNVQAYDINWVKLLSPDLAKLKAGDKVRFTVAGSASSGNFDKARFTINGSLRPEVAGVKPSSTPKEIFDEYTIPAGVTSFTVNAQIHHQGLNQWF